MSDHGTGPGQVYAGLSYLVSGLICYGGLGWLGDRVLGTRLLMPLGMIVGLALGTWLVARRLGGETTGPADSTKGQS